MQADDEDPRDIEDLFAHYIDRLNSGERIGREEILAENPVHGPEILEHLEGFFEWTVDEAPDTPLGTFGGYTLRRRIGRGGMGVVYEAWQDSMERRVAVKVLPKAVAVDSKAVSRFIREAQVAGKLSHPNIVQVHGMGVEEQIPYYAMEFVEGETLAEILSPLKHAEPESETVFGKKDRHGYFEKIAESFAAVADGLQHAHSKGVIHRDIKPSNLILDREGHLRILDFGLARLEGQESLTASGDFLGTPLYMSPEQARRKKIPVDHRTDIYSLGATLYEMLALRPPFQGKDYQDTLSQIIERVPVEPRKIDPRIPRDLETIVLKCLRKDPAQRFGTAEALGQDLRRFVRGEPIEARPESGWEKLGRQVRRYRVAIWTGGILSALLAVVSWLLLAQWEAEEDARRAAYDAVVLAVAAEMCRDQFMLSGGELANFYNLKGRSFKDRAAAASWKETALRLEEMADAVPERPDAPYYLARLRRQLGEYEAALRDLERALAADPGFAPAEVLREEISRKVESLESDVIDRIADRFRSGESWQEAWLQAYSHFRDKRWKEAAAAYGQFLAFRSRSGKDPYLGCAGEALMARGVSRLRSGDFERAIVDFSGARRIFPRFPEAGLLLGKALYQRGSREEAGEVLRELYEESPADGKSDMAVWIGFLYDLLRDWERRDAWVDRADDFAKLRMRSQFQFFGGRFEECAEDCQALLKLEPGNPHALGYLGYARFYLQRDRFGPAWDEERRQILALASDLADRLPSHAPIRYLKFAALLAGGKLEEARAEAERVMELQVQAGDDYPCLGHSARGLVLRAEGRFEEAVKSINLALELDPNHAIFREELARTLDAAGKTKEALSEYERIAKHGWGWAIGHSGAAEMLIRLGRCEEAIAEARKAIELPPKNTSAYGSLAYALWKAGTFEEAAAVAEEGMRAVPGRVEPYLARGLALESLGRGQAAAKVFCVALDLHPEYVEAHEALVALLKRQEGLLDLPEVRRLAGVLEERAPSSPRRSVIEGTLAVLRGK